MLDGWGIDEGSGDKTYAWSKGGQSILAVPLPTGADIRMDFEVLPFVFRRSPAQRVTIVVNGTVIDEVQLSPELQSYSVILPAKALGPSPQTVEFRYAYARAPRDVVKGSPDERELAVAWFRLDFAPVNP
jgi:hypothetical protein